MGENRESFIKTTMYSTYVRVSTPLVHTYNRSVGDVTFFSHPYTYIFTYLPPRPSLIFILTPNLQIIMAVCNQARRLIRKGVWGMGLGITDQLDLVIAFRSS